MKSALIIIDIQNDYFPGGNCELHNPGKALLHAGQVLAEFRTRGLPVHFIQHVSLEPDAAFFLPDTKGVELHRSLAPRADETIFVKHYPNAFLQTGLSDELLRKGIHHLVICGMMSHICIDTTVRAAQNYGFSVTLLEDACATKNLVWNGAAIPAETVHDVFMASLNGTFASVVKTADFLADLKNPDTVRV